MKKILLCFSLFFLLFSPVFAKKVPGYFISNKGDTIQVHFRLSVSLLGEPSYSNLQNKAVYFNQQGEKHVLRPAAAREIGFFYKNDTVRMLSRFNSIGLPAPLFHNDGKVFLKLEADGQVKLFSYKQKSQGGFGSSGMPVGLGFSYAYERYVLQYGSNPLLQVKGISFRRDMMDFFSDYPELVEKIDQRMYRKENLALIVKEYNHYKDSSKGLRSGTKSLHGF